MVHFNVFLVLLVIASFAVENSYPHGGHGKRANGNVNQNPGGMKHDLDYNKIFSYAWLLSIVFDLQKLSYNRKLWRQPSANARVCRGEPGSTR